VDVALAVTAAVALLAPRTVVLTRIDVLLVATTVPARTDVIARTVAMTGPARTDAMTDVVLAEIDATKS
jgi:hypothetical protein